MMPCRRGELGPGPRDAPLLTPLPSYPSLSHQNYILLSLSSFCIFRALPCANIAGRCLKSWTRRAGAGAGGARKVVSISRDECGGAGIRVAGGGGSDGILLSAGLIDALGTTGRRVVKSEQGAEAFRYR